MPSRGVSLIAGGGLLTVLVVVALVINGSSAGGLPGLQTGSPPWSANSSSPNQLRGRLAAIDLSPETMEGQVIHTHQHLDVFVDGRPVVVPANIGISVAGGFLASLHTHDDSGIIHVESPEVRSFTLGQFFDVWGVALTPSCIGGSCQANGDAIATFVNGSRYAGDVRDIALTAHEEICLCVGSLPAVIPSAYAFPAGL